MAAEPPDPSVWILTLVHFTKRKTKMSLVTCLTERRRAAFAAVLIVLPALASVVLAQEPQKTPIAQSNAQKMLAQMKSLAGTWRGTVMEIPMTFTIRPVSSATAVLHEGHTDAGNAPKHEITMFYIEDDRLLATHYCDGGSRSRLEGKLSADGKTIEFGFLDVAGSTRGGYIKGMAFTIIDANRHTVEGIFVTPDGKSMPLRGDFHRDK